MGARGVGEDLHRDVRLGAECVQVLQLFTHDVRAADGTPQCRFVQDDPQAQRTGRVVDPVLTAQPHLEACAGLFGGELGDRFPEDRVGVAGVCSRAGIAMNS
jgi:hypothetical protein